jgi:hypothetical protein
MGQQSKGEGFEYQADLRRADQRAARRLARPTQTQKDGAWRKPVHTPNSVTADAGMASIGARTNTVTNSPVPLYIDAAGNLGVSASTRARKNIGSDYKVDMAKFLAIGLKNWSYIDNPAATGMGPIADDLDAAGLKEFVIYNLDGSIQGIRTDTLLMGLWSAYVQSRTTTLARIANQAYQTQTVTGMAALTLGGTKQYAISWPAAFADANYMVVPTVYSTGGLPVAGATAAVIQGTKTATGCTVQVNASVAILSGQTLVVEATHI